MVYTVNNDKLKKVVINMTKEQAQELLQMYLANKIWTSLDFETHHNFDLEIFTIQHDLENLADNFIGDNDDGGEDLDKVFMEFAAKQHYVEAIIANHDNPSEENKEVLNDMLEGDLENVYNYDMPTKIKYGNTVFLIENGNLI